MKLTEFIAIAQTVGAIPHEILQDAERRYALAKEQES